MIAELSHYFLVGALAELRKGLGGSANKLVSSKFMKSNNSILQKKFDYAEICISAKFNFWWKKV